MLQELIVNRQLQTRLSANVEIVDKLEKKILLTRTKTLLIRLVDLFTVKLFPSCLDATTNVNLHNGFPVPGRNFFLIMNVQYLACTISLDSFVAK